MAGESFGGRGQGGLPAEPEPPRRRLSALAVTAIVAVAVGAVAVPVVLAVKGGDEPGPGPSASASGSPGPTPSTSIEPSLSPGDRWAALSEDDRPPYVTGQDLREPQARDMAEWVWDYVDDTWSLEVFREINNEFDMPDPPVENPIQTLFLVAPDGDRFRLFDLRTDIPIVVEHFSPSDHLAFLLRGFYEDSQTVQLDLVSGTVSETWAADGFPADDTSHRAGWFVFYEGTLGDGREVWTGQGYAIPTEGVFFRTPFGGVTPSAISPVLSGLGEDGYGCIGIDADDEVAIYTANHYAWETDTWTASWIVHDLAADTWTQGARAGFIPESCHPGFDVTTEYWIGLANNIDAQGLYRVYFDGRPDEKID